jgi:hypothetical protein
MENIKSNTGQNLGVAAIITAIISFVIAVIPCIGLIAVIPAIISIVLGAVCLSQSANNQSARGLSTASLIVAIVACLISISQIFVAGAIIRKSDVGGLQNVLKEVSSEIRKNIENENFSIRIEKDGKRIIIDENTDEKNTINSERQRRLEILEGVIAPDDSLQRK